MWDMLFCKRSKKRRLRRGREEEGDEEKEIGGRGTETHFKQSKWPPAAAIWDVFLCHPNA